MSESAFAAAMRPNVQASSTTGVKKSVVSTRPWPPAIRTTAASSPSSRPTTSSAAGSIGPLPVSPATTASSSPGGILHAQPPPCAYWVSRTVAGALVTRPNLGAVQDLPPGRTRSPRRGSAGSGRRPSARPAGWVSDGAPNSAGSRRGAVSAVSSADSMRSSRNHRGACRSRRGLGGLEAVAANPRRPLPLPAPADEEPVVVGAGQQLRLDLAPADRALAVAVADHQHPTAFHGLLDHRAQLRRPAGLRADPQTGGQQLRAPARIGFEHVEDLLQRAPAGLGVGAVGLRGEGDRDGRGLLRGEGDRGQRGGGTGHGAHAGRVRGGSDSSGHVGCAAEASGCLVAPAASKADVAEQLGQAGSIPVRLRQAFPRAYSPW